MTSIKLLTAYDERLRELGDLTSYILKEYAVGWYCQYSIIKIAEYNRPAAWYKIKMLLDVICRFASDWYVWIDADACIMNREFDLRAYLDSIPKDVWLIAGSDENGFNSGVMFVRNCKQAEDFFNEVYSRTEFLNHVWWEQAAIQRVIKERGTDGILIIPNATFNAYDSQIYSTGTYKDGDFILHCPSLPIEQRISLIKKHLKRRERLAITNS